ncbi:hypothetical protein BLA29_004958 [Euroglyphus maynei]|uniref:Uncharacterized protein n=1 Tax=Euroglyphus maynei TaxID=6958 RepID=A0A1Y3BVC4_EURMA|nr:hypothetical protein BLA29_004958 [Euroglyphus maynei]
MNNVIASQYEPVVVRSTTQYHHPQQHHHHHLHNQNKQQNLIENNNQTQQSSNIQTSGWTPVTTNNNNNKNGGYNNPSPNILSYTAINPSLMQQKLSTPSSLGSESIVDKVVPLVVTSINNVVDQQQNSINVSSQYLASESISRNSYQTPQNAYMIHPTKYKQAFFPAESIRMENSNNKSEIK